MNLEESDKLRDIKAELKDIILECYIEKHTIDCDKKEDTGTNEFIKELADIFGNAIFADMNDDAKDAALIIWRNHTKSILEE